MTLAQSQIFFLHLIVKCYGNQYRVVNKDTQSWSSYRASVFMVKLRYITYTQNPGLIIEKINSNHLLILIRYHITTILKFHKKLEQRDNVQILS